MADLSASLADLVKCSICMEVVDRQKSLSCQHSFCVPCLENLDIENRCISCPICSQSTLIPDNDVTKLKDNMMVRQLAMLVGQDTQSGTSQTPVNPGGDTGSLTEDSQTSFNPDAARINSALIQEIDVQLQQTARWLEVNGKKASACIKQRDQTKKGVSTCFEEYQRLEKLCQAMLTSLEELNKQHLSSMETEVSVQQDILSTTREAYKKLKSSKETLFRTEATEQQLHNIRASLDILKAQSDQKFDKPLRLQHGIPVQLDPDYYARNKSELIKLKVPFSSIGIAHQRLMPKVVTNLESLNKNLWVIFPEDIKFIAEPGFVTPTKAVPTIPYKGDRVRVKDSARNKPDCDMTGAGILKAIEEGDSELTDDAVVTVDFPERPGWKGRYSDVEKMPGCGLQIGDAVRVNRFIGEPSYGWQGINGSSVGQILSIQGDQVQEELAICFPECQEWRGKATEVVLDREPMKDDFVQVKLSVTTPTFGWSKVSHNTIGRLVDIKEEETGKVGIVGVPGRKRNWRCLLSELETPRYDDHDDDDESSDNDNDSDDNGNDSSDSDGDGDKRAKSVKALLAAKMARDAQECKMQ